jgi:hypothetical protein
MANRLVEFGLKTPRRVARVLPSVSVPTTRLRVAPRAIGEGADRRVIDCKLDAALKETIKQSIGSPDPRVEKVVDGLALDYRRVLDRSLLEVIVTEVVPAMQKQRALVKLAERLAKRRSKRRGQTIAKLLQVDTPLAEHPLFVADVRRSKLADALRISGLAKELVDKIDTEDKSIEAWNDLDWDAPRLNESLTASQRDELRFTADLGRLTEHYGLVESARKASVRTTAELVALDTENWLALVKANPTSVPEGLTAEAYSALLDRTVQHTYPSQYFGARVAKTRVRERLPTALLAIEKVLENNPELLTELDRADVDWTSLDERQLAPALREVTELVGTYRHLGLAEVASDGAEMTRRVTALERFIANHGDHDLRTLNLLETDAPSESGEAVLDWTGVDAADRPRVKNQVLAYQRVLHLTSDYSTAIALLHAGLDSSAAISDLSFSAFLARTGLSKVAGGPVYRKASHTAAKIESSLQLMKDAVSAVESGKAFQGIDPKFVNDLKDIAGYAELFGDTTYCDCDHCRSIFSPAAYFTDLMYFIDRNITKLAFAGKPTHPIRLRTRRPDLWFLKLTCANTDTLIPHLTLVNEILGSYLQRSLSIADPPKTLSEDRRAIGLPFHLPLSAVREYLRQWKLTLRDVYDLLDAPASVQLAETLGLADGEWTKLSDPTPLDLAWLTFSTADHTRMDAVEFSRFAALTRAELGELAETKIAGSFAIVRIPTNSDIQSEKEVVLGLTSAKIDRIGRFLRLARSSKLTLTELDETLIAPEIGGQDPFSSESLTRLARFKRLPSSLGLSVESLIGVLDRIPTRPMKPDGSSLSTELGLSALGLPTTFHHAKFATVNPADATVDPKLSALLGATGLVESDLLALFELCETAFPFDANGNVQLTASNVGLLYAYATLAKTWRISVSALGEVVAKRLSAPGNDFRTLARLEALEHEIAGFKTLPLSISDAFSLTDPSTERVTIDVVAAAVSELQQSGARSFGAGLLLTIPGIEAEAESAILATLVTAGLLAKQGESYTLTAAYTPAADLGAALDPTLPAAAIHARLLPFHFLNFLPNALGAIAGMAADKTLIAFAFARPGWEAPAMLTALATPIVEGVATEPADLAPLVALANDLARVGVVFDELDLDTDDAWFVAQYPAIFAIEDVRELNLPALIMLRRYRQLRKQSRLSVAEAANLAWQYQVRANGNQPIAPAPLFGAAAPAPVFANALGAPEYAARIPGPAPVFASQVLVPSPLAADELELWAERAALDGVALRSVFLSIALPTNAIDGMLRALELQRFCQLLGTGASSLSRLLVRGFEELESTARWLLGLIGQRHQNEAARREAITIHTRALNEPRRDALCDYIIARNNQLGFRDRSDLYAYFLIDVEMGACFDTSRLVAALSSLQLYVYRCLVNLEQAESDGLSVLPKIDADDVREEWEWRKNYRVWEANRKVFLYPESYIEPELRDDKTPLFEKLEEDLLQREITLQAAEQAYHDYLATFSTLARLKVVAVCYDDESEIYWFVARSHADPYTYHLRRYHEETSRWEPWEAIDVGISAAYVSALVHVGRLYLFWVESSSLEKTDFVGGSSIFSGVEHQLKVLYSYRESNGKWSANQKLVLIDKLIDRAVTDETPPFIDAITNFAFVGIDKTMSREMADFYRSTKTYAKVIATKNQDSQLKLHYYRQSQRTDAVIETIEVDLSEDPPTATTTHEPVSDEMLERIFIDPSPGEFKIVDRSGPSLEYYRATLDLITNRILDVKADPHEIAFDGEEVPFVGVSAESKFYDGSSGVEAIGLFYVANEDDPDLSYITLMLRKHAVASNPAATDAMLITRKQKSGSFVSNGINAKNAHDVLPVHGKQEETVLQHWQHQHWIRKRTGFLSHARRLAVRINTTLDYYLTEILFTSGIERLLTLDTQTSEGEAGLLFQSTNSSQLKFVSDPWEILPFKGSFGLYYQELFFHIPFLIANQLNSQGNYAEAKYWYEKIFNPTAPAPANDPNIKHRVWQYHEFRDVNVPKLKDLLTNAAAIEVYHDDPFNPHAIARLRLSAYQKAIVMKYIDNLLDWADDLFTQATMESVNEAIMLYVLAAEILGPRPVSVGPCKTADEDQLTYQVLGPAIAKGSEFLMYVENVFSHIDVEAELIHALPAAQQQASTSLRKSAVGDPRKVALRAEMPSYTSAQSPAAMRAATRQTGAQRPGTPRPSAQRPGARRPGATSPTRPGMMVPGRSGRRRPGMMRHYLPAFCVPPNEILLGYWDRIDDRLFKIRHCLDINGQPLKIALFQPPIDPMLLVRAKAAGLSIEGIVGRLNEPLPAYRFTYLLEKARHYVGSVQSFGSALLSALEKQDGEQLALLRSTHEQNLLKVQRSNKQRMIEEAQAQLGAAEAQQGAARAKLDHYTNLLASGLNTWESLQQGFKHTGTALKSAEAALHLLGGIIFLLPDTGSPFAMKYGGSQLGQSQESFAQWYSSMAGFAETAAGSAGLEATFQRRTEDWDHALAVASEELTAADNHVRAATLRLQVAERDLELYETQLEQAGEVHDFLKDKFTNDKLYTFLSSELMKLYREAYQMAAQLARQAERAFQFERDSTELFIQSANWQSDRSGLLAGERLLIQLQRMEKAYVETNTRELEVRQSISLLQINPGALSSLQQTGTCEFTIDEVWFDLLYPGQYRRLLKSARLTIPCVVGPYVNVAAKLQLLGSQVRRTPELGANLSDVPLTMVHSVATSNAQNDSGLFELNFRDERYLPFEGAGAVNSSWSLELPSQLRMFDYASISDVIITLEYTARYDGALKTDVETNLIDMLKSYAQDKGLFRMISLREELPDAFHQLCNPPADQTPSTSFPLDNRHFPAWLATQTLKIEGPVAVWPQAKAGETLDAPALGLKVAGANVGGWADDEAGSSRGTVSVAGSPIRMYDVTASELDKTKLADLVLLVKYSIL